MSTRSSSRPGSHVRPRVGALSVVEAWLDRLFTQGAQAAYVGASSEEFEQVDEDDDDGGDPDDEILHLDQPPPPAAPTAGSVRMVNQILEQADPAMGQRHPHRAVIEDGLSRSGSLGSTATSRRSPRRRGPSSSRSSPGSRSWRRWTSPRTPRPPGRAPSRCGAASRRVDLRVKHRAHGLRREDGHAASSVSFAIPLHLTGLGLDERQSKDLIESIQSPHGLMLVTGPTGSGKSTTLYACLNPLNEHQTNICTVEDPVEYKFKGMNPGPGEVAQIGLDVRPRPCGPSSGRTPT